MLRKAIPLVCVAFFAGSYAALAQDQKDRFVEFQEDNDMVTYDLNTVKIIQPERFTVLSTTIDNLDVMKYKLTAFDTLQKFCTRTAKKYPVPVEIFTLGPPDMQIENIEVKVTPSRKIVWWSDPYQRLAAKTPGGLVQNFDVVFCDQTQESRSEITNGLQSKELFDCKRGLVGFFLDANDDPAQAIPYFVSPGTRGFRHYLSVCYSVTHEVPFQPN